MTGLTTAARTATELELMALAIAEQAADLIRASIGKANQTGTKSSATDAVTETDLASEQLIRGEVERLCPDSTVVGEEFADLVGSNDVSWIVDPLDGTINFLYDLPVMSVSIAAAVNGTVVAGAVVDVLRGERFSAARGYGARRDGKPISVSAPNELATSMILTGFSYDPLLRSRQADVLTRVLPATRDIRCFGSAAVNLCLVACGRSDAYFERDLKIYDYAAGALIAAEAGAIVNQPAQPGELLLAAAPTIHGPLKQLVAEQAAS